MKRARAFENYYMLIPTALILLLLLIYPIFYTLKNSLSEFSNITFTSGQFVGFRNYLDVLSDNYFWGSIFKTIIFLAGAMPLQIFFGVLFAFILSVEWPGVKIIRALLIVPMIATPVVAGSIWKMILDPLWGYLNYLISIFGGDPIMWLSTPRLAMLSIIVIDSWRWTPFIVLIVLAGIVSLDQEPMQAAKVDGANWLQTILHIKLPMLKTVIFSAFVVRWMGAVKIFDIIFITTRGGPGNATDVINLNIYETAFKSFLFDKAAAQSIILIVMVLSLTFFLIWINSRSDKK